MTTITRRGQLSISFLLSFIVHGGVALWLMNNFSSNQHSSTTPQPLSIELSAAQAPRTMDSAPTETRTLDRNSTSHPATRAEMQNTTPHSPRSATSSHPPPDTQNESDEFEAPFLGGQAQQRVSAAATASTARREAALRNDVVSYLTQQFKTRFVYPHHARRRGWQGRVLVHIEVNREGMLERVEIAESSGYDVLDRNAVETFRRIRQLDPHLHARLTANSEYAIPVIYRLTRG